MADIKNNLEYGDFMVELDKHFLGSGQCSLGMVVASREIRRDAYQTLRERQLKSIRWSITVDLKCCRVFWDWLTDGDNLTKDALEKKLFQQGAVLKLYPVDPRRRGYRFERVFLDEVCEASGGELQRGNCVLKFAGEASSDSVNKYLTRMGAGAKPDNMPMKKIPSGWDILQYMVKYSAGFLDAVSGQTLLTAGFAPGNRGSYCLELISCQDWQLDGAFNFNYRLTGRFPEDKKEYVAQKMIEFGQALHGCTLQLTDDVDLIGTVEKLACNHRKIIEGRAVTESCLDFTITVD